MESALETRALTRTFGDLRAVDGIDLTVPAGSFYGFLGPNGAGKSTTIKCLTGLLAPTSGSMRILGLDPIADPVAVKRKVGVVPEDLALFDIVDDAEKAWESLLRRGLSVPNPRVRKPREKRRPKR